jgi:hypothetical protein
MTRPDHTAVPPAGVIAAAWPEATDIDLLRDAAHAYRSFAKKHDGPHQAGLLANAQRLDQLIDRIARAEGAAPTAAQAAGRSEPDTRHPVQPLVIDPHGRVRFKRNAIVDYLAEGKLNDLARMDFPQEDWEQLAQLIGYSLDGFGTLSYVTDETWERAASHAPNATLAASCDAKSATSGATSAAKLAVPAGWKLVPIDPTDAMVLAPGAIGTGGNVARIHREIWRRMLEAAPAAPLKPE